VLRVVTILMLLNAAVFLLGAVEHAGVAVGPLQEPQIVPAAIVETLCAAALIWGTFAKARWASLAGNLVAITGVAIGMVALALGAGPRTASNDIGHAIMMLLAAAALGLLAAEGH